MSDRSTAVLQGRLERAVTGDADLRDPQARRIDAYKAAPLADGAPFMILLCAASTPAPCPTGASWMW